MGETIISWNIANWVTVVLMAIGGYALFVLGAKFLTKGKADD